MVIRIVDDDEELLTSFRFLLEGAPVFWHGTSAWLFTYNKLWTKTYLNGFAVAGGAEYNIYGGMAVCCWF